MFLKRKNPIIRSVEDYEETAVKKAVDEALPEVKPISFNRPRRRSTKYGNPAKPDHPWRTGKYEYDLK